MWKLQKGILHCNANKVLKYRIEISNSGHTEILVYHNAVCWNGVFWATLGGTLGRL